MTDWEYSDSVTVTTPGLGLSIEVDFTTPALQIPLDWVDVSDRARAASVHQGRQRLLDRTEVGQATVVLDNRDRFLDPSLDADIHPLNHLRIAANLNGVKHELFRGFIRSWPQEWPESVDAVTTIQAEDAFSLLSRYELAEQAIGSLGSGAHIRSVLTTYGWPEAGEIPPGSTWWLLGHAGSALGTNTFLGESLSQIDTGRATIMALTLTGNLLEHLLNVAENTEGGTLYIGPSGDVVFIERPAPHQPSIGTWGDVAGENRYTDLAVVFDDDQLFNDVRVTRRELETTTATDTTSIDTYGQRTLLIDDTLFSTQGAASEKATEVLGRYKQAVLFPERLVMHPKPDSSVWPLILGMPLMTKITVRRRPPGGGAMIELDCLVIGIDYQALTDGSWEVAWALAPTLTLEGFWYMGFAGASELGTTTVLA